MANLTGSWLAFRLGVDPVRIERMRREGELYAVRNDSGEWEYPGWQFDAAGELRPAVAEEVSRVGPEEKIAPAELSSCSSAGLASRVASACATCCSTAATRTRSATRGARTPV